jgi:hypothetical protein
VVSRLLVAAAWVLGALCVAAQAGTVYVNGAASGSGTGRSWETAFSTIQAGINAAALAGGGEVWVAAGTYPESIRLASAVQLYGGFAGIEDARADRQPRSRPTLIDASRAAAGGRAACAVRIRGVTVAGLDGFVVGGSGGGAGNAEDNGGISIADSTGVTVADCVLTDNRDSWRGNALNALRSSLTLERCRIAGNSGTTVWLESCVAELQNCLIIGNTAATTVLLCQDSSPTLRHCTIAGHTAAYVVRCAQGSSPVIANSLFVRNRGALVYEEDQDSDPQLRNDLSFGNIAGSDGLYYDGERGALADAAAINLGVAGARLLEGDPRFVDPGLAGTWTGAPAYAAASGRTVFTDSSANWVPGALSWRLLVADTALGDGFQILILSNTATTLEVAFDQRARASVGASYRILDYHLGDGSAAIDRGAAAAAAVRDDDNEVRLAVDAQCDLGVDEAPASYVAAPDLSPPVSQVGALPAGTRAPAFEIPYQALDPEGPLLSVQLYYRRAGSAWALYAGTPGANAFAFDSAATGGAGRYEFYTIATDVAGNSEPAPGTADAACCVLGSLPGNRLYVRGNATGAESGGSWADALRDLQAAADAAAAAGVPEVWVAAGVYTVSLAVPSQVALYGGFAGAETALAERAVRVQRTIIDAWQAPRRGLVGSFAAVTMDGAAGSRLDGFYVTGGMALSGAEYAGGGVYLADVEATTVVANCVISGNQAYYGGGIYCSSGAAPTVVNCVISGNYASYYGGAVYCEYGSHPTFGNCTLDANLAGFGGSGVRCSGASPTLANCLITNHPDYGLYLDDQASQPLLASCLFFGNGTADAYLWGTGVGVEGLNLTLAGASGNITGDPSFAVVQAGTWTAAPTWSEVGHTTTATDSSAVFPPMGLAGYTVVAKAGSPFRYYILNNTGTALGLVGDWDQDFASGDAYAVSELSLADGSAALHRAQAALLAATDIDGDPRPGADGLSDIGADEADSAWEPLLVVDTTPPQSLVRTLPAAVAGAVLDVPFSASDLESGVSSVQLYYRKDGGAWTAYGAPTAVSPIAFDAMAAGGEGRYEFYTVARDRAGNVETAPATADAATLILAAYDGTRLYVNAAATGAGTGTSWANAATTVTAALATAETIGATEVRVAKGVYVGSITLRPVGLSLYGGFAGSEGSLDESRDVLGNATVLTVSTYVGVVNLLGNGCRLDGFTVTGGYSSGGGEAAWGGGIRCSGVGNTVANCQIVDNLADWGGGIYIAGAAAVIENCALVANRTVAWYGRGGGIYVGAPGVRLSDCLVAGCSAELGGGISAASADLVISNLRALSNSAWRGGAALLLSGNGPITIANSLIHGNLGGVYCDAANTAINNTIFTQNAQQGFRDAAVAGPELRHCLFHGNPDGDYIDNHGAAGTGTRLWGAQALNLQLAGARGNVDGDPLFAADITGAWTAGPTTDQAAARRYVFTDSNAAFVPSALVGRVLEYWAGYAALIIGNTATTITAIGSAPNVTAGTAYRVLDFHLQNGSAALDRGQTTGAPATDAEGTPRPGADGLVDIGPYEAPAAYLPVADSQPPVSYLVDVPAATGSATVLLPFLASDPGGGVQGVELWFRREGADWTQYGAAVVASPLAFDAASVGGDGRYEFYTIAFDEGGNREAAPATPDAVVRIMTAFAGTRLYVDQNAAGAEQGDSWATALRSVANAASLARDLGIPEIWVARGVYTGPISIPAHTALYGGFAGGESTVDGRQPLLNLTVLDGAGMASGDLVRVEGVSGTLIDGFVIMRAPDVGVLYRNADGSNRIENCLLTGNGWRYYDWPGAIRCDNASPSISDCWICGNLWNGLHVEPGAPTLTNCLIAGNYGDGIGVSNYDFSGGPTVNACTIADQQYSGLSVSQGELLVLNSILVGNGDYGVRFDPASAGGSGALWLASCLLNGNDDDCRFDNASYSGAAAINGSVPGAWLNLDGDPRFRQGPAGAWTAPAEVHEESGRTVLTDTTAVFTPGALAGQWLRANTNDELQFLILANTETTVEVLGTFSSPPRAGDSYRVIDYQLRRLSPGVDTGYPLGPDRDLAGQARPVDIWGRGQEGTGTEYDVGAYEFYSEGAGDLAVTPTGTVLVVGPPGGPFAPAGAEWTLSNGGAAPLEWVLSTTSAWLQVAPTQGTLNPGASATVVLTVDAVVAAALPAGMHSGAIQFQDSSGGGVQTRSVSLRLGPDYFTQVFAAGVADLCNQTLEFTPTGARAAGYSAVRRTAAWIYPTDPSGGTPISFDYARYAIIALPEGQTIPFYGVAYSSFLVGADGFVAFGASDYSGIQTLLQDHFSRPQIAGLFTHLNPYAGGRVLYQVLGDRAVVTFDRVPERDTTNSNSFQIEVFFAGTIRLTHLRVEATTALAGLSSGGGVPADFYGSVLRTYVPRRGDLAFIWSHWRAGERPEVELEDRDLAGAGQVMVPLTALAGDAESLVLTETPPWSGIFRGDILLAVGPVVAGDGTLQALTGDTLTARYADADDGAGLPAEATATAVVDNTAPLISGVAVSGVSDSGAVISFSTDEPTYGTVRYGSAPGDLSAVASSLWLSAAHQVHLQGLPRFTQIFFAVMAEDRAGNQATDNNAGANYALTTGGWGNLRVLAPTATPAETWPGASLSVDWRVRNDGQDTVAARWEDGVYLSADDQIGADAFLGSVTVVGTLPVSGEMPVSGSLVVPALPAGQYGLVVSADVGNGVPETDESDNATLGGLVTVLNPNLACTPVGSPPPLVATGARLGITWDTANPGDVPAALDWHDSISLSTDDQPGGDTVLTAVTQGAGLTAGATRRTSAEVWIPDVGAGQYWLVITVDAWQQVPETAETDNVRVIGPFAVERPNLVTTILDAPLQAMTRRAVQFIWEVTNQSGVDAPWLWSDRVTLSTDDQVSADDLVLGTYPREGLPLAGGERYEQTVALTVPEVPAGDYWLLVVADYAGVLVEAGTADNSGRAGPIPISLSPCPDLVVSSVQVPPDTYSDQHVLITWTLGNQGNETAVGPWTDQIFLAADLEASTPRLLASFAFTEAIPAGETVSRTQAVLVPFDVSGAQFVVVRTDTGNAVFERHGEGNNRGASADPMTVTPFPYPNLVVTEVTAERLEILTGEWIGVSWRVLNAGAGPTSTPRGWSDAIFLSVDQELDDTDTWIGERRNPSYLAVGDSYANTAPVFIPGLREGDYYVLVLADSGTSGAVNEGPLEIDNVGVGPRVHISTPPPPDLLVRSVVAPLLVFSREVLEVTYRVANVGEGTIGPTQTWQDEVRLSADQTLDGDDRLLGRRARSWETCHLAEPPFNVDYEGREQFDLPVDLQGEFFLFVRTDALDAIDEVAFEDNNINAGGRPIRVVLTPPPDLEVSRLEPLPGTVLAGHPFAVTYEAVNYGATATPPGAAWHDAVYLAAAAGAGWAEDRRLGTLAVAVTLAPDASYTRSLTATLPPDLPSGTYSLYVAADDGDEIFEVDDLNNRSLPVSIVVEYRPADLVVRLASAATTVEAGTALALRWSVQNLGTGATVVGAWTDRVLASVNAVVGDGDDIVLGSVTHSGILAGGGEYDELRTLEVPFGLVGPYHLFVVTDVGRLVYESDDTNNASQPQALIVTRHVPDLEVSAAAMALEAGRLRVTWTVANPGTNRTNVAVWHDAVYLAPDEVFSAAAAILLKSFYHAGALAVAGSYTRAELVEVPPELNGEYYVFVVTDYGHAVEEAGELDNNVRLAGTLSPTPDELLPGNIGFDELRTRLDLVVPQVTSPLAAYSGQEVAIAWTVRNVGARMAADTPLRPEVGNGTWVDRLYLSRDRILDPAADTFLGESTARLGDWRDVAAGSGGALCQEYTATRRCRVPLGLSGPFFVIVVTDRTGKITEYGHEDNNVGLPAQSTDVRLLPPSDVTVSAIAAPELLTLGEPLSVGFTLSNPSDQPFAGVWWDRLYLSADPQFSLDDVLAAERGHDAIAQAEDTIPAHDARDYTFAADTEGLPPGAYHLIARTDVRNSVAETDESNNTLAATEITTVDAPALETVYPDGQVPVRTDLASQGHGDSRSLEFRFPVEEGEVVYVEKASLPGVGECEASAFAARDRRPESAADADVVRSFWNHANPFVLPAGPAGVWHLTLSVTAPREAGDDDYRCYSTCGFTLSVQPPRPVTAASREIAVVNQAGLGQAWTLYFKFEDPGNRTLRVVPIGLPTYALHTTCTEVFGCQSFCSLDDRRQAVTDLRISYGQTPTFWSRDVEQLSWLYSQGQSFAAAPLIIPRTQAGTYYLRLDVRDLNTHPWWGGGGVFYNDLPGERFAIRLEPLPFTVLTVDPPTVGNTGEATLRLTATRFTANSRLHLLHDGVAVREPVWVDRPDADPALAYVTFDLRGLAPDTYEVQVTDPDMGTGAMALQVRPGTGPAVHVSTDGPGDVRLDRTYVFYVHYGNSGDTDAVAPLLRIRNLDTNTFSVERDDLTSLSVQPGATLQLLGLGRELQAGRLRPGESHSIPLYFRSAPGDGNFWVDYITAENQEPLDVAAVEAAVRPADLTAAEWAVIWPQLQALLGPTWGTYVQALAGTAADLDAIGERLTSVPELLEELLTRARYPLGAQITGSVRGVPVGDALEGAQVWAVDAAGQAVDAAASEAQGRYALRAVPAGSTYLVAELPGYARTWAGPLAVVGTETYQVDLLLAAESRVRGTLVMPAGQDVPADVSLTLERQGGLPESTFAGQLEGNQFLFAGLAAGTYDLTIQAAGYAPISIEAIVVPVAGERLLGSLSMVTSGAVAGTVTSTLAEVTLAQLQVGLLDGDEVLALTGVEADGSFRISGLRPGAYAVTVLDLPPGAACNRKPVTLAAGTAVEGLGLMVTSGSTVSGQLTDVLSGTPLSGVLVRLIAADGSARRLSTDVNGRFAFVGLAAGEYRVGLSVGGAVAEQTLHVSGAAGATVTADLGLAVAATVAGTVTLADASPVALAQVTLRQDGQRVGTAVTDDQGQYVIHLLQAGRYDVRTTASDATWADATALEVAPGANVILDVVAGTASLQVTMAPLVAEPAAPQAYLLRADGEAVLSREIDALGQAVFANLAAGDYLVVVVAETVAAEALPLHLEEGEAAALTVTMAPAFRVFGRVLVEGDERLTEPPDVELCPAAEPTRGRWVSCAADGGYAFTGVAAGDYTIRVQGAAVKPQDATPLIVAGEMDMDLTCVAATTFVTGRLTDANGGAIAAGYVELQDAGGTEQNLGFVDAAGQFRLGCAAAGPVRLRCSATGYATRTLEAVAPAAGILDLGNTVLQPLALFSNGAAAAASGRDRKLIYPQRFFVAQETNNRLNAFVQDRFRDKPRDAEHVDWDADVPHPNPCNRRRARIARHRLYHAVGAQNTAYYAFLTKAQRARQLLPLGPDPVNELVSDLRLVTHPTNRLLDDLMGLTVDLETRAASVLTGTGTYRLDRLLVEVRGNANPSDDQGEEWRPSIWQATRLLVEGFGAPLGFGAAAQAEIGVLDRCIGRITGHIDSERDHICGITGTEPVSVRLPRQQFADGMVQKFQDTPVLGTMQTLKVSLASLVASRQLIANLESGYDHAWNVYLAKVATARAKLDYYQATLNPCGGNPNAAPPQAPNPPAPGGGNNGGGNNGGGNNGGGSGPGGGSGGNVDPMLRWPTDPNDIVGPAGLGAERWVGVQGALSYRIRFENVADASAPAQVVTITQQLDPALDFRTFRVNDFGWGEVYVELSGEQSVYHGQIDLPDASGLIVDVVVTVNVLTGAVSWTLTTLDPATGDLPMDALAGFLPPNDTTGRGEGFVTYTVRPRRDAASGIPIDAQARIVFDLNEPIDTPAIFNTLDAAPPQCRVDSATLDPETAEIAVSWNGSDEGSGLAGFTVYVSDRGGAPTAWLQGTGLTAAVFQGQRGHTYSFNCLAEDQVGNRNPAPAQPDVTVVIPGDPPHAAADAYATTEDTVLRVLTAAGVLANDHDPEGAPLTAEWVSPPTPGPVALAADGSFVYTPAPDFNGPFSFTYRALDGQDGGTLATVVITVQPVNDPPTPVADSLTIEQDSRDRWLDPVANDTDADGDPLALLSVGAAAHGVVAVVAGWVHYSPDPGYYGPDRFSYAVVDATGAVSTGQISVTVVGRVEVSFQPGWNLFSLPVEPFDAEAATLLAGLPYAGPVWGWNGQGFTPVRTLQPLQGYWLFLADQPGKASAAASLEVRGVRYSGPPLSLTSGWHLLGIPAARVPIEVPSVRRVAWGWNALTQSYEAQLPPLQPARAYWIFLDRPAVIPLE